MIMITKWKCDFKKRDLQHSGHLRMIVVEFFSPSPYGIVARHEALPTRYNDLALDFS